MKTGIVPLVKHVSKRYDIIMLELLAPYLNTIDKDLRRDTLLIIVYLCYTNILLSTA